MLMYVSSILGSCSWCSCLMWPSFPVHCGWAAAQNRCPHHRGGGSMVHGRRRRRQSGSTAVASRLVETIGESSPRRKIMSASSDRRRFHTILAHYLLLIIITLSTKSNAIVSASKDAFFCGTSWADASSNCDNRQPCPNAADDECATDGHICFADTLCSAEAGHGERFKYIHLATLVDIDYADTSNSKFCGSWWASAEGDCSVATHCPEGSGCANQNHCYDTACNVQDIVKLDLGADWKALVTGMAGEDGQGGGSKMGESDPRRNNYCGLDWGQASTKCTQWCLGNDEPDDCPRGQKCFAETSCYYDDDLEPTSSPISTDRPTKSPISRSHPANKSFCGGSWGLAIQNCSHDTHCFNDQDCVVGEKCYMQLPGCDLSLMYVTKPDNYVHDGSPTGAPLPIWMMNPNDAANFRFCGVDWTDAANNCNLDRHCPDNFCKDAGLSCFQHLSHVGATHCNAYEISMGNTRVPTEKPTTLSPTKRPTGVPTPKPSKTPSVSPTTPNPTTKSTKVPTTQPTVGVTNAPVKIINGLCAESFEHLEQIYRTARECSNIDPCVYGQLCFPNVDAASFAKSPPPSSKPASSSIESPNSSIESQKMPTYSPTSWYSYSPTAESITTQQPVAKGSTSQQIIITQAPVVISINTQQPVGKESSPQQTITTQAPVSPAPRETPIATPNPTQNPTAQPSDQTIDTPSMEENDISNKKEFYCATTLEELELSCGTAVKCGASIPCPPGQGCIQYNYCKETQQTPESEDQSEPWNYFPDLCPMGFVGLHSPVGDCKQYYECQGGFLEASHVCEVGELFDNSRGKCISQKFVSNKCTSADQAEVLDLCPKGLIGHHSPPGKNCEQYYDCYDGVLGSSHTCAAKYKFDNVRGECFSHNLVGSDCNGVVLEVNNEQHQIVQQSGEEVPENFLPDLCPEGLIGLHAKGGDCTKYYECNDMLLVAVNTCNTGFKFDNTRGECISQKLVDRDCNSGTLGTNTGQDQPDDSQSGSNPEAKDGEGNSNDSLTDPASETGEENHEEEKQIVVASPDYLGTYSPDLCPPGFNGYHAKEDCTKFYECTDGYVGSVHTCSSSFKFDKVRERCISGELVSEYCYGPSLQSEQGEILDNQYDEEQNTTSPKPSPSSAPGGRPMPSNSNVEGGDAAWSYTATPSVPENESEPPWSHWIRDYENGERSSRQGDFWLCILTLLPILFPWSL